MSHWDNQCLLQTLFLVLIVFVWYTLYIDVIDVMKCPWLLLYIRVSYMSNIISPKLGWDLQPGNELTRNIRGARCCSFLHKYVYTPYEGFASFPLTRPFRNVLRFQDVATLPNTPGQNFRTALVISRPFSVQVCEFLWLTWVSTFHSFTFFRS